MNFMMAVKHAVIGYGIRRAEWRDKPGLILSLDNFGEFYWLTAPDGRDNNAPVKLLGSDLAYDLIEQDIKATDWETVSG